MSHNLLMQRLKAVIASKDAATVAACLPAWAYVFNKLVMDNNRSDFMQDLSPPSSCTAAFVATLHAAALGFPISIVVIG